MLTQEDLASFLGDHAPFNSMAPDALAGLATASSIHRYEAGAVIVDYSAQEPGEIWLLCSGQVVLLVAGSDGDEPFDTVPPGGLFGFFPLLTGGTVQFVARATEPSTVVRLPGDLVRAEFAKPAGLSFLASSAWKTISGNRVAAQRPSLRPVGDLVHAEPVFTTADTTIRDAVRHMTEHRSSYVLIPMPDGELGIFTDRDLRTRVVAAGVGVDAPIGQVMSVPARWVTADRIAATVLIDMLEKGLRHMPVRTQRGEVIGVLEEADLVATSTRQSFLLRRSIALAANAAELQSAAAGIADLTVDLYRSGTDASGCSGILSVVIDSVVRRALELELTDRESTSRPQFAWLTLGSVARREAMPSSDVDSALSWADEMSPEKGRFLQIAARVHATLDACGLPSDTNGALASKPLFARSSTDWARAAAGWLDDPMKARGLIMSSLLLDGRVVWGEPSLHTVPSAYRCMPVDHPNALRLQLLDALAGKVRTRSLRDVVARRGGTFDLKSHALTPIVNLARWGGLTVGVVSASTPARLEAAAGNGILSQSDSKTLSEVFGLLQGLRMAHQIDQIAAGCSPGDIVTMSELSPLNRSLLNDGVREIAAVQRRVRQMAAMKAGAVS
ncbi:putative nucleotidyltransferase substrate binding domain-containing protein [Mycobacterium sp. URHB0044]|uniref:putative nucleotidyltransferase substrate binding domain-containing protein n=1 Tax=Mycobacterium sp. URHB0044 TaxID=1380386 RepID=UPI00048BD5D1|nr:putative nucleotidyltransferase substrate binding domain-containing protein [Mycobacterium sp. URHB0044]